jgi:hypothetical protein
MMRTAKDLQICDSGFFSLFGCLFLIFSSLTFAGEDVLKSEQLDSWIEPFQVEYKAQLPNAGTTTDIHYLLFDRQIHAEKQQHYTHVSYRFLTESGVQDNSQITLSFDPNYEKLTLHRLRIFRGDEVIDKLVHQKIDVIRRETGAERQVYDGRLSAMMVLEDTRVGDIVEYAYSLQGSNPVFDGHFFTFETTCWSAPLHQYRLRVLWHKSRPVVMKNQGSPVEPKVTVQGDLTIAKLDQDQLLPVISDGDLPGHYFSHPWIDFSDFPDWASVSTWASAQFPLDQALPPSAKKEIERLNLLANEEDRILGAVRWVQDSIRYVGFFQGIHSHRPFPLDMVVNRRFGDCKDKSNLLSMMLREMGIKCRVGLVSTQSRKAIQDWLPTPEAFDHAIVGIDTPRGVQWVDGTASYQRGPLRDLYLPDYSWVLALESKTRSLVTVNPRGHDKSKLEVKEDYIFQDYRGSVNLRVESVYKGARADSQRAYFASHSQDEIERGYLNFYAESYPKIRKIASLEIRDNEAANELTTIEKYEVQDVWRPSITNNEQLEFKLTAQMVRADFFEPTVRIRTMPFLVPSPRYSTQSFHVEFPTDMALNKDSTKISNSAFEFSVDETCTERLTDITYHYHSKQNFVDPADTSTYLADIKKAKDQIGYTFTIPASYAKSSLEEIASEAKGGVAQPTSYRPAWTLIIVTMLSFLASSGMCVAIFFWDPSPRPSYYYLGKPLVGMGGWLLVVGFKVLAQVVVQIWATFSGLRDTTSEVWSALTHEGSAAYKPLWEPFLIFDCAIGSAFIPIGILLVVLFFRCRTSFVYIQGAMWIFLAALNISEEFAFQILEITDQEVVDDTRKGTIQTIFNCVIWIPYLMLSKRVRNTFTQRRTVSSASHGSVPPPLPTFFS